MSFRKIAKTMTKDPLSYNKKYNKVKKDMEETTKIRKHLGCPYTREFTFESLTKGPITFYKTKKGRKIE